MAIGVRQLVLLTRLAIAWPKPLRQRKAITLFVKGCEHKEGCPCWVRLSRTPATVIQSLVERGFITRDEEAKTLLLTKRGWEVLNNSKGAPVKVETWTETGPDDYTIRRSMRPDFRVLY